MIARRYLPLVRAMRQPTKRDLLAERRAQIEAVRAAKVREALRSGQRL